MECLAPLYYKTSDTSILVRRSNPKDFHNNMIDAFTCAYNWFRIHLLSLNINKTHCVQFKIKTRSTTNINIVCNNRLITTMSNVKFLGIHVNDSLNSSCHVESIIPKLSSACYIVKSIKPYMPINTMKTLLLLFQYYYELWFILMGNIQNTKKDN
jgi:hypothetical protein